MGVHVSPILNPLPNSFHIPSLWVVPVHQLWVPCLMHRTWDWSSISHMVIYMFQCYSLKSSHPCLFPQSPKSVLYICVSFAVSHIGSSFSSIQFSSFQLLSRVWLFVTSWITARPASLSITNSQSSLRLTSIESVMPSSHLILCRPLLLLPPIPRSIRVFSNESTLCMRWPSLPSS